MYKKEIDLVKDFIKIFKHKYGDVYIKKEVKTKLGTKTDIVITKQNTRFSFEAKLNNIISVWFQALTNKNMYDYSYVVLPYNKKNAILKNHIKWFKDNELGVILVKKYSIEFLNKIEAIL